MAPKVTVQSKTHIPPEFGGIPVQPSHITRGTSLFTIIVLIVLVLAILVGGLFVASKFLLPTHPSSDEPIQWGKERVVEQKDIQELGVGDSILETKVRATVVSAKIQGGRMGSYDGVCKDITVVSPVKCRQTTAGFIIYAPLSNGAYFCEDKSEKGIVVAKAPLEGEMCQ